MEERNDSQTLQNLRTSMWLSTYFSILGHGSIESWDQSALKIAFIHSAAIKRLNNPLHCQQILLLSQKNIWVQSSPKSSHTAHLSVHWTHFDCNRILVSKQLQQALHRKFLTFRGNFKLQIRFQLPSTRCCTTATSWFRISL